MHENARDFLVGLGPGIFHSQIAMWPPVTSGFPALVRIGRDFGLRGNSQLLVAPEMPSLRAIDGNVEVQPGADHSNHSFM